MRRAQDPVSLLRMQEIGVSTLHNTHIIRGQMTLCPAMLINNHAQRDMAHDRHQRVRLFRVASFSFTTKQCARFSKCQLWLGVDDWQRCSQRIEIR